MLMSTPAHLRASVYTSKLCVRWQETASVQAFWLIHIKGAPPPLTRQCISRLGGCVCVQYCINTSCRCMLVLCCRTSATASTWSLQRLDALAAEVVDTLTALEDSSHTPPPAAAGTTINKAFNNVTADGSSSTQISEQQQQQQSRPQQDSNVRAAFAAVRQQAQQYPMQVLNALNHVLFRRHGYSACNR